MISSDQTANPPTKGPRTVSANIVSVDEEPLDAQLDEATSELVGTERNERTVHDGLAETLAYTEFPPEHWRRIRTNNGIERIDCEIRRRTRAVGTYPDGNSVVILVSARLKYIAEHEWGKRRYLDMSKLEEMDELKGKAEG